MHPHAIPLHLEEGTSRPHGADLVKEKLCHLVCVDLGIDDGRWAQWESDPLKSHEEQGVNSLLMPS